MRASQLSENVVRDLIQSEAVTGTDLFRSLIRFMNSSDVRDVRPTSYVASREA